MCLYVCISFIYYNIYVNNFSAWIDEQARKIQMGFTLSTLCDNELMFADTAIIFNFVFAVFFSFVYLFV